MEDKEIREKLLSVIRNNIQDFVFKHYERSYYSDYSFNGILLSPTTVDKKIIISIPPKYFWQKTKQKERWRQDYSTFNVSYGEFRTQLTKEEYEEIIQIREEKLKKKQLKELEKLCNKE